MALGIEVLILCILLFLMCFLGTGSDLKNIKSFKSYPLELRDLLLKDEDFKDKIKPTNPLMVFGSNLILFLIIFFICGSFFRQKEFLPNFVGLLILGMSINLFDLLVIDLIWWRNTKRSRFKNYPDKKLYSDPREHIYAFFRGALMYLIIALIDGALLMLF